jgi:hypothetical protein
MGVAKEDYISRQAGQESTCLGDSRGEGWLGGVCPTGRVWISQPAKKNGRCVEGREE